MNKAQRRTAIVVCIVIVVMFLFPPVAHEGSYSGYEFIAAISYGNSVNAALLFVQLMGVVFIGAIAFYIARNVE
jgi:hypothetical protein